ncbi:cytochrome P450 [Penicillium canescens]|nr:cytochrome P450 [Penicillium canescens]KAJ6158639.1 cytochrome P450 [Penicillium canescens]
MSIWLSRSQLSQWTQALPNNGLIHIYDSLLGQSYVAPCNIAAVIEIFGNKKDYTRPEGLQRFFSRILGNGLLTTEGEVHQKQRRLLGPAFSTRNIHQLHNIFWMQTTHLLRKVQLQVETAHSSVEITELIQRFSVDVATLLATGQSSDDLAGPNRIAVAADELFQPTLARLRTVFIWVFVPWLPDLLNWRQNTKIFAIRNRLRVYCLDFIQRSRHELPKSADSQKFILSTVLADPKLSDDEVTDHMMTTLLAGSETPHASIVRCCDLLCRDQILQARLRSEIRTHLPSIDQQPISAQQFASLPLLHGVIEETLRLYPPVPVTLRQAICDTTVQGQRIPKGTQLVIDIHGLNRNSEIWGQDSNAFVPERWLDNVSQEHQSNNHQGRRLLTFAWGHHSCIGMEWARTEMRCAIAGLVGRFQMELTNPDIELREAGTAGVRAINRIQVKFNPVEGW